MVIDLKYLVDQTRASARAFAQQRIAEMTQEEWDEWGKKWDKAFGPIDPVFERTE